MKVLIGWAPHELIWLKAAMSMPRNYRMDAYRDVAALINRTVKSVQMKACMIRRAQRKDHAKMAAQMAYSRSVMVPERQRVGLRGRISTAPSCISRPTKAQLMGAR